MFYFSKNFSKRNKFNSSKNFGAFSPKITFLGKKNILLKKSYQSRNLSQNPTLNYFDLSNILIFLCAISLFSMIFLLFQSVAVDSTDKNIQTQKEVQVYTNYKEINK